MGACCTSVNTKDERHHYETRPIPAPYTYRSIITQKDIEFDQPKIRDKQVLISGYIRDIEDLIYNNINGAHLMRHIPFDIVELCSSYCGSMVIRMQFVVKPPSYHHLSDFCITDGDHTITHTSNRRTWKTCVFGPEINHRDCDLFDLHFDIKNSRNLYMGYITESINESLGDSGWDYHLQHWNVKHAVSFYASDMNTNHPNYSNAFDDGYQLSKLWIPSKSHDSFAFTFDFVADVLRVYRNTNAHDPQLIKTCSLRGKKSIMPAFSLCNADQSVTVTKYTLRMRESNDDLSISSTWSSWYSNTDERQINDALINTTPAKVQRKLRNVRIIRSTAQYAAAQSDDSKPYY
eukprot:151053_1